MFKSAIEGIILGLSTGTICFMTCTPIYLPYIMSEDRKLSKSFFKVFEISAGRFFSYILFGAGAGFIGKNISSVDRDLFTSIAYILLSIYLILSTVRTHKKSKSCHIPKITKFTQSGFLLGVLTGINFCPSFLIALSRSINLGGVLSGMMLFFGFFLGTTVFLLPLGFMGHLAKIKKVKILAQLSALAISIYFISSGSMGLYNHFSGHDNTLVLKQNERVVDAFSPNSVINIISSDNNTTYFKIFADSIKLKMKKDVNFIISDSFIPSEKLQNTNIFFIDSKFLENYKELKKSYDCVFIESGYSVNTIIQFMKSHTFKVETPLFWKFNLSSVKTK